MLFPIKQFLQAELERLSFEFSETLVNVRFIQEFTGINYLGIELEAAKKGSQQQVPLFIAEILLRNKLIDNFWQDYTLSLERIGRLYRSEIRSPELQSLDKLQYLVIKEVQKNFPEMLSKRDLEQINLYIKRILNERLPKIVNSASVDFKRHRIENLTRSEELIYYYVREILSNWKELIIDSTSTSGV